MSAVQSVLLPEDVTLAVEALKRVGEMKFSVQRIEDKKADGWLEWGDEERAASHRLVAREYGRQGADHERAQARLSHLAKVLADPHGGPLSRDHVRQTSLNVGRPS